MDLSNAALSVVVNHSVSEELTKLREENKMLRNRIKSTDEDITRRQKLYQNLVALARSDPDCPKYENRIERIKSEIGEDVYQKELAKLMDEDYHEWTHGFNSGMLASTRLYGSLLQITPGVYEDAYGDEHEFPLEDTWMEAKELFPDLYT